MSEDMNAALPLAPSVETNWRELWKGAAELCALLPYDKIAVGTKPDFEIPYGVLGETKTELLGLTNIGSLIETSVLRLKVTANSKNYLDTLEVAMQKVFAMKTGFRLRSKTTVGAENCVWSGIYDWDYSESKSPSENDENGGTV